MDELTERLRSRGLEEPEIWADSELQEDLAQTARFLFLHALGRRLDYSVDPALDAVEKVRVEGGTREEMRRVLQSALYDIVFDFVYLLDEADGTTHTDEPRFDVAPDEPRWALMELSPEGEVTGGVVSGLHESLDMAVDWGF